VIDGESEGGDCNEVNQEVNEQNEAFRVYSMHNRVVLNYMVKIKLRAMLSLAVSNNTFL